MAKCIKHHNNTVKRVSDQKAKAAVKTGYWHYVPKSTWKGQLKK